MAQEREPLPTDQPRWLDEEELRAWRELARIIVLLPAALDAQLQEDAGLTHFEYGMLAALSEAPDRTMRLSDLAVPANASLSRLSRGMDRLVRRGWVRRTPDPDDGRCTLAELTDDGWERIRQAAPGHVETVRSLVLEPLTRAQVRQLGEIGRRIMGSLQDGSGCGRSC